jgi:hypothetical protein
MDSGRDRAGGWARPAGSCGSGGRLPELVPQRHPAMMRARHSPRITEQLSTMTKDQGDALEEKITTIKRRAAHAASLLLALSVALGGFAREASAVQPFRASVLGDLPNGSGSCGPFHNNSLQVTGARARTGVTLFIPDSGTAFSGRTFEIETDSLGQPTSFTAIRTWFMPPHDSVESVHVRAGRDGRLHGHFTIRARDGSRQAWPFTVRYSAAVRRLTAGVLARCPL